MDDLVEILNDRAQQIDGRSVFTLTNTSVVIRLEARTRDVHATPEAAFANAREMLDSLLASGYTAVNAGEIGANIELFEKTDAWRGKINVPVWPTDRLGQSQEPLSGLAG